MIHTQVGAFEHKDEKHTTKSSSNPSVPTPPLLSRLQKTEGEKKGKKDRNKKEREICSPACDVAMDTTGNHEAKKSALRFCAELKIHPASFSFICFISQIRTHIR